MKNIKPISFVLPTILLVAAGIWLWQNYYQKTGSVPTVKPAPTTVVKNSPATPVAGFNKNQYSIDDPKSIWVVVNKKRPLNPANYIPSNLVIPKGPLRVPGNESMQVAQPTATAMEAMFAAAKTGGLDLMISSGYRSYTYQTSLYDGYVKSDGQAVADTQSARPGHSEHQTGWAADIEPVSRKCEVQQCFGDTPEGKWLAANAYKYGFIIRYLPDKTPITGYMPEPWHVRYIGVDLATEMHKQAVTTLEEFFGLSPAPTY
jgi:D-alanyl-D-alanine carboxypeptidase